MWKDRCTSNDLPHILVNPNCLHPAIHFFCLRMFRWPHSGLMSVLRSPKLKFWMDQLELEYFDLLSLFEFLAPWQRMLFESFSFRKAFVVWWRGGFCCNVYLNISNGNVIAHVAASFLQITFVGGSTVCRPSICQRWNHRKPWKHTGYLRLKRNACLFSQAYPPENLTYPFPKAFLRMMVFLFPKWDMWSFPGGCTWFVFQLSQKKSPYQWLFPGSLNRW